MRLERRQVSSRDLDILKTQIGFGTAFKATLGFYAGQFVATMLGLVTIGLMLYIGYLVLK